MISIEQIGVLLSLADETGLGVITDDPVVVIDGEKIAYAGPRATMPPFSISARIDAEFAVVMPGLIDCHSHLIFAGERADEFARRMSNESYQTIMAKGGGIMSTVTKTRTASDEELIAHAMARAERILAKGVTTLEVKSGYGLSFADEVRLLRIAKHVDRAHALDIHPSFLGAHVVPPDFKDRRGDYVQLIIDEMLPAVQREKLAHDCDVFCEAGAFTVNESREILARAHELGLGLRAHVQQLSLSGGIALVRDLPIKSVSHADFLSDEDIAILARKSVVVELLPIAALFLRSTSITPVEKLRRANVPMAIATDFNPGSAMCHDLILAARLGVTYFRANPDDALRGITKHAALALGRDDIGAIKTGALADIVITNCTNVSEILYDWTKHPIKTVMKRGKIVAEGPRA